MSLFTKFKGFLSKHRFTSQFLLSQFDSESAFYQSYDSGELRIDISLGKSVLFAAFFSPSRILHVQGDIDHLKNQNFSHWIDGLRLKGLNGPTPLVKKLLPNLQRDLHLIPSRIFNDLVYKLNLPIKSKTQGAGKVRLLQPSEFESWHELYVQFIQELGLASTASKETRATRFLEEVHKGWHWGTFTDQNDASLVAIAAFNAKSNTSAQVGGVFTVRECRGKGYATSAMAALLASASSDVTLKELILFTGAPDSPPGRLYTRLGFKPVDQYSMVLFER
jgi:RimJ/RimL family protein N-acetyltransferase